MGPEDGLCLQVVGRRMTGDVKVVGRRTTGTISPLRQSHGGGGKEAPRGVLEGCVGEEGAASCVIKAFPGGVGGQVAEAAGGATAIAGAAAAAAPILRPFNSWGRVRGQLPPLPPAGIPGAAAALAAGSGNGGAGQLEVAVQQLATDQQGLLALVQQMAAEQSKLMQRLQVQQVLLEQLSAANTTAPAATAPGAGATPSQPPPAAPAAAAASASSTAAPSGDPVRSRAEVKSPIKEYIQSGSSKEERSKDGANHSTKH